MFIDLFATISAGFALAGLALALRWVLRRRLPAWIVPVAAGLGMLSFAIWNEYSWYPRTVAALPREVVVARAQPDSALWRPWTYVRPIISRFSAVDTRTRRTNPDAPGQVLVTVILVARWQPGLSLPVLFDCDRGRRAALTGEMPGVEETWEEVEWEDLAHNDESLRAACTG